MKRYTKLLLASLAGLSLVACGKLSEPTEDQPSASRTSQETSSAASDEELEMTEEEKLAALKSQYAPVFEDYEELLAYAGSGKASTDSPFLDRVGQTTGPMNSWVAEGIFYAPESQQYAFYDLDQNGTSELLVGSRFEDNPVFLTGVYYLENEEVRLLAQGFSASGGGARSAITLYTDGSVLSLTWSSGTGQGQASLYQLQEDNTEVVLEEEKDFQFGVDDIATLFAKDSEAELDLEGLDWQTFKPSDSVDLPTQTATASQFDLEAILSGNLSSMEGRWQSLSGNQFTIQGNNLIDSRDTGTSTFTISNIVKRDGQVSWTLAEVMVSPPSYNAVPAGQAISKPVGPYDSDESKDRIFLAPQYPAPQEEMEQHIYYRAEE